MKLLITGASGFIGRHLVPRAIQQGHKITAVSRDKQRLLCFDWARQVEVIEADIEQKDMHWPDDIGHHDALIHLAWRGLPNYQQHFHLDDVLPAQQRFLGSMLRAGIKQILVSGTCLEYGKQCGQLTETLKSRPDNPYAQAKDALRQSLQQMQHTTPFVLQWCRLFYMYGKGQGANSLLSQLEQAIARGDETFNMSAGEQLRDYLPVETVAEYLLSMIKRRDCDGIFNIASGEPISILSLVKLFIKQRNSHIRLNTGYYPYPEHEAMAFWGDTEKLRHCLTPESKAGEINES